jgi:Holliday junction DNA helicase RuvB
MSRPAPRFHDFIGQKAVVDLLRRTLGGAQARNEPFPHTCFHGTSGAGKTLLTRALASEMGINVIESMGYDGRATLTDKLARLDCNDFLLIDECHGLGPGEQELLCEAIDHGSIPPLEPKPAAGQADSGSRVSLPPWTLVLATDQPGRLLNALHKRIDFQVTLTYYNLGELKEIVEAMAVPANLLLSPQAAKLLAEASSGLPRRAKQHLQLLRLYYPRSESQQLGILEVREYLDAHGFDQTGLTRQECRYLEGVARLGASSLESIAQALGSDPTFVRRQIEPVLSRRGLVRITPSGRQLTDAGREWASRRSTSN